jgi:hypothetical protein
MGRRFISHVDLAKDYRPARPVDMRYLAYRELMCPVDDGAQQVMAVRDRCARGRSMLRRKGRLDGKVTKTMPSTP